MKQYIPTSATPPFGTRQTRSSFSKPPQKVLVYDVVHATKTGMTAPEIAAATNLVIDRVRYHLSELKRDGLIAVKGDPTTVSPTMNATEAAFAAMLGLENALIARVREDWMPPKQVPPEIDRAFLKYNKIKERALRPGTDSEGRVAIRMSLIELVKAVF